MAQEHVKRKLAAIFYADIAGYSRLIGEDEEGTHRLVSAFLDAISTSIEDHNGVALHFAGDAVLAEFATVSDALICAVNIQNDLSERNSAYPDGRKVQFRIGINLGEVIVDRGEIFGNGVNVAARLEGLAEPGGICISAAVFDAAGTKLPFDYAYMGEQSVKNIENPIRAYSVKPKPGADVPAPSSRKTGWSLRSRIAATAATVAILLAAGVLGWYQPWRQSAERESVAQTALPLPARPSIAVLPFTNMSGDPRQEYFADGITDDLITDLAKISGLFVIARNSTFAYKGQSPDIRAVARDLGVRYVLEGSVRRVGDEMRINAQLIDATTGGHLWAERYDATLGDIFRLQDKVTRQIVVALSVGLTTEEQAAWGRSETAIPQAYDALLQGWELYNRQTPEDMAKAIPHFEKAVELDPSYSRAYAGLAAAYWSIVVKSWTLIAGVDWQHALDKTKAHLAKALKRPTSDAYRVSSELLLWQRQHEKATAEIDRAIALAPNDAENYVAKAWIAIVSGQAKAAETNVRLAMRLNPSYRAEYLRVLGLAIFHQNRYTEAAEILKRAMSRQPNDRYAYRILAAAYGHLERSKDAQAMVAKYNEIVAGINGTSLTVQQIGVWFKYRDKAYLERYRDGLRKAGVPEGATPAMADNDFERLITKGDGEFDVDGATKIDVATAKKLSERGVLFVDVRSRKTYANGYIPNAVHLDLHTDLNEDSLSKLIGKDDEVVFYCFGRSCYRSANACAKAILWGFTKVYYFAEGLPGWRDAGYPVATK